MISIAGPRDNNNESQPHSNVYSATGQTCTTGNALTVNQYQQDL